MVIGVNKGVQGGAQLFQGLEGVHVKGSHPLVFERAEPAFNFRLCSWGVRPAVMDGGPDSGCKKPHLLVFIGAAVVKVENFWPSELGNSGFYHGHEIYKSVIIKYIGAGYKTAGIIYQGDDENFLFSPV